MITLQLDMYQACASALSSIVSDDSWSTNFHS